MPMCGVPAQLVDRPVYSFSENITGGCLAVPMASGRARVVEEPGPPLQWGAHGAFGDRPQAGGSAFHSTLPATDIFGAQWKSRMPEDVSARLGAGARGAKLKLRWQTVCANHVYSLATDRNSGLSATATLAKRNVA